MRALARTIIITGFMGAGKTTVAAALAHRLRCRILDLDSLIEERSGRTPQEIIDGDGEKRFREIETEALRYALSQGRAQVLALGGGTWTMTANRALINEQGALTVWLDAPFELCWRRVAGERVSRPFARDEESARLLYDARREFYDQARLHVKVREDGTPEAVAAEIADALSQNMKQDFNQGRTERGTQ
ncbi:MAG TPA: shikimate kinase [Pyrinomonadaceae bacterium]|nr:shikimate kinase [Pyrinomonadaceae bacterium]